MLDLSMCFWLPGGTYAYLCLDGLIHADSLWCSACGHRPPRIPPAEFACISQDRVSLYFAILEYSYTIAGKYPCKKKCKI